MPLPPIFAMLLSLAAGSDPAARPPRAPEPPTSSRSAAAEPASGPAAAPPEAAILVLRSGQRLPVRSYVVEGRVVRIVDEALAPLLIKADLVDLERSAEASEKHREALQAELRLARLASEARATEQSETQARSEQRRVKSRGALNVAPPTAAPRVSAKPKASDTDGSKTLPERVRREREELSAKRSKLVEVHNELVRLLSQPLSVAPALRYQQLQALRAEIDALDARLAAIDAQHAR